MKKKLVISFMMIFAVMSALLLVSHVSAYEAYDLIIDKEQVDSVNCNDVLGNGVFKYDPSTRTLYVRKSYMAQKGVCIKNEVDDLTIYVEKNVSLSSNDGYSTLNVLSDANITGSGKLSLEEIACYANLTLYDADVEVSAALKGNNKEGKIRISADM